MTLLSRHFYDPFGVGDFFEPTFTRKVTIDHNILADKKNYSIWELPDGSHEVRVQYSSDAGSYHRATNRKTLEEAEEYVETQSAYHKRRVEGPKMVKQYT